MTKEHFTQEAAVELAHQYGCLWVPYASVTKLLNAAAQVGYESGKRDAAEELVARAGGMPDCWYEEGLERDVCTADAAREAIASLQARHESEAGGRLELNFVFEDGETVPVLLRGTTKDLNRMSARLRYWEKLEAAQKGAAVPEGWKLVPVAPTQEMQQAGVQEFHNPYWGDMPYTRTCEIYRAMLSASPPPPAQVQNEVTGGPE